MTFGELIYRTNHLQEDMTRVVPPNCSDPSLRAEVAATACRLSLEHWEACRFLMEHEYTTPAIALHRCQFEAVVRSAWVWFAATEGEVDRLSSPLSEEGLQAAKNLAGLQEMIADIGKKETAPPGLHRQLCLFRDQALKPINSVVHAGLHPLHRTITGYPEELVVQIYRNLNSVAALSWMQVATIENQAPVVEEITSVLKAHTECFNLSGTERE